MIENKNRYNKRVLLKNNPELHNKIIEHGNKYFKDCTKFKELVWLYLNGLTTKPTCACGSEVNFVNTVKGFRSFCSPKCASNDEGVKDKLNKTSMIKYGTKYPNQNNCVKEKIRENINHDFRMDKIKKTNLNKYGVEFPLMNRRIFEKTVDTLIERHGVNTPFNNKQITDKRDKTFIEKYGTKTPLNDLIVRDKIKNTMITRHGCENTLQSKELTDKVRKTIKNR